SGIERDLVHGDGARRGVESAAEGLPGITRQASRRGIAGQAGKARSTGDPASATAAAGPATAAVAAGAPHDPIGRLPAADGDGGAGEINGAAQRRAARAAVT